MTPAAANPAAAPAIVLVAMLSAVTSLSQFYRSSLAVIAPEIAGELALSPRMLGAANGAFFLAIGAAQIPTGMLFDRIGARRTVSLMTALAVLAAILHLWVQTGEQLVAARFLLGLGCAASFMSAVLLCSRWFPPDRLSTSLSWVFALSQIGIFLAATPLAVLAGAVGWRWASAIFGIGSAAVALMFYALVRDSPPGAATANRAPEPIGAIFRGLIAVWRTPGLGHVLAIHTFAYASMATVLGLWAGPYLADVHGLDGIARGNVLLAMGFGQLVGTLAIGPLDRAFNTRKWVVVTGALATIAVLLALALLPRPPLWLAAALLVALCFVTSYGIVIVAHGRSLFPEQLAGRGVTTVNMAQVLGATILPVLSGAVVGLYPATAGIRPEIAYRMAFGSIAACLAAGLAVYLVAKDSRPRPD
jgi:MFS family permease